MQYRQATGTTAGLEIELLMSRYQQADAGAAVVLIVLLNPQLHRLLGGEMGNCTDAGDMLQDVWLRIHRVRHTYWPSDPLLPWVRDRSACEGSQLPQAPAHRLALECRRNTTRGANSEEQSAAKGAAR